MTLDEGCKKLEEKAWTFAIRKHGSQMYNTHPYEYHLRKVVEEIDRFGLGFFIKIMGILHDTIEDTDTTYQEIFKEFGYVIAEGVYDVTDELGRNRKERKAKTYPKIRANHDALAVKLCDRIANFKECIRTDSMIGMYLKEHKKFKEQLDDGKTHQTIWNELERLVVATKILKK